MIGDIYYEIHTNDGVSITNGTFGGYELEATLLNYPEAQAVVYDKLTHKIMLDKQPLENLVNNKKLLQIQSNVSRIRS